MNEAEWHKFRRLFIEEPERQDSKFYDFVIKQLFTEPAIRGGGSINIGTPHDPEMIDLRYDGRDTRVVGNLFAAFIRQRVPAFVIDNSNSAAIDYLTNVYCGKAGKQGAVIRGNVGSGKTLLLLLWLYFRQNIMRDQREGGGHYGRPTRETTYTIYDNLKLISLFMKYQYGLFERRLSDVLVIDDAGSTGSVNHYGIPVNIIENIILRRYEDYKRDPRIETYITTNLTAEAFSAQLGARAHSRCMELMEFNSVILIGKDRRHASQSVTAWNYNPKMLDPFEPAFVL